jgi:hypothetical protein
MEFKTPTKEERIALHRRGAKMIMVTMLLGVLAGILSSPYFLSQPVYAPVMQNGGTDLATAPGVAKPTNPDAPNHSSFAFLILAILVYAQKFIFPYLGIDSKRFGFKDWFFLAFMTFCFWFITWTVLLNGPAPAFGPIF